jgi:tetratricopeptide (TPR) repeat protein
MRKQGVIFITSTLLFIVLNMMSSFAQQLPFKQWDRARKYFSEGKYMESIEEIKEVLKLELPNQYVSWAYNLMARCYHEMGDIVKAESFYKKSLEKADTLQRKGEVYLDLGTLYGKTNRNKEALELLKRSLRYYETDKVWFNLGLTYNRLEMYDEAVEPFENAVKLNSNSVNNLMFLANAYMVIGHIDKSIPLVERASKIAIDSVWVYGELGNYYREIGDNDKACEAYRRVLEIDPQHKEAKEKLNQLLSGMK